MLSEMLGINPIILFSAVFLLFMLIVLILAIIENKEDKINECKNEFRGFFTFIQEKYLKNKSKNLKSLYKEYFTYKMKQKKEFEREINFDTDFNRFFY